MKKNATYKIVCSALCLALAMVLPFLTGQIPQIGKMLCPMHIPVLLAGFVCGGPWGLAVGFIAPLLRSAWLGMPLLFPDPAAMAFELALYGLVSGLLYRRLHQKPGSVYLALITAMICGRVVWGIARLIFAGLQSTAFTFSAFIAGALTTAIPGIIVQLLLIPLVVLALRRAKLVAE